MGSGIIEFFCPACTSHHRLQSPGVCPECGPLKFFVVEQPRVRRVVYRRQVWAPDEAAAIRIVECGTAWPDTYDECTLDCTEGDYSAKEETNEQRMKFRKQDVGFPDE